MAENSAQLITTFNFRVILRESARAESGARSSSEPPSASDQGAQLGEGGFQECSGLEIEMDVTELVEGGRNDGIIQRVGRGKYTRIVLKRGMFLDGTGINTAIWRWLMGILSGERPVVRYDGMIEVLDSSGENEGSLPANVVATWTFDRGLPAKVVGPQLNAKTGEIAIEELHIAHEGLKLVLPPEPGSTGGGA
jgi:phage tail-like protein